MRKTLPALAVLAAAALTLGACNNPNDDVADNTMADTAATMPADNTMVDTNVMTNTTVDTNVVDTNTATNTTTNTTY